MSLTLQNAIRAFKDGAQIDFRQTWSHPWEENPFRQALELITGSRPAVVVIEGALGANAEFRIRPAKRSRIELAASKLHDPAGFYREFATGQVRAALKDVREHLATNVVGHAFVDKIEADFCGTPTAITAAVMPGQRWLRHENGSSLDRTIATVRRTDSEFAFFEGCSDSGGWMLERFQVAGNPVPKYKSIWFEYVGGPL